MVRAFESRGVYEDDAPRGRRAARGRTSRAALRTLIVGRQRGVYLGGGRPEQHWAYAWPVDGELLVERDEPGRPGDGQRRVARAADDLGCTQRANELLRRMRADRPEATPRRCSSSCSTTTSSVAPMTSVAIVGGGFGGIGAAAMLRRAGYPDATVFERAERVGGVWQHNTYPGAACDIPSHLYEFSFAPNPRWSRRFAPGPEIQAYLEEIARPLDVRTLDRRALRPLRRRALDAADQRGRVQRRRADRRLRPALDPERAGAARARRLRRPGLPHRPLAP